MLVGKLSSIIELPLSLGLGSGAHAVDPVILGLATGVPPTCYPQGEIFDFLQTLFVRARHARTIFNVAGVETRHMAADREFYASDRGTQARNDRYLAEALPLGEATLQRCLANAGLTAADVDDLFVVSCTGLDIPGLDLRLAGRLGMRPDLRRTCVLGMGCYAAFPALQRAREAVAGRPGRKAMVLCVELCSLHLQFDDSLENMVVSALFADGAAAVVVGGAAGANGARWPTLVDSATHCDYTTFEHMAFHVTDHGFQMRLTSYVPELLAADVTPFVDGLLARSGLARADVRFWGIHPGGPKILDSLQARLGLSPDDLAASRAVLRRYGNMSSPTILFILERMRKEGAPRPCVALAFGPGLAVEAALLV